MTLPLREMHCTHVRGAALEADACLPLLAQVQGWAVQDGALCKRFAFTDFHQTMAFVNAVAAIAHAQDHHPDMQLGYSHCTLRWSTHSVGGLSINDFICAAQVDALSA
jgi:4a-hydroxytetrahydrobiopterin dehydratase